MGILLLRMKLTGRSRSTLALFLLSGVVIGSLAWEVLERILARVGVNILLGVGPIGFDLRVLAVSLMVNPGTILGAAGGAVLFRVL